MLIYYKKNIMGELRGGLVIRNSKNIYLPLAGKGRYDNYLIETFSFFKTPYRVLGDETSYKLAIYMYPCWLDSDELYRMMQCNQCYRVPRNAIRKMAKTLVSHVGFVKYIDAWKNTNYENFSISDFVPRKMWLSFIATLYSYARKKFRARKRIDTMAFESSDRDLDIKLTHKEKALFI